MGKPSLNRKDYEIVQDCPEGLTIGTVENGVAVQEAREEVQAIFNDDVSNQISLNKHFFINLPFPLTHEVARESETPTLSLDDRRISSLVGLIRELVEDGERLSRANIIVREYLPPRQHIAFHVDDLKCEKDVFGLVLLNEDPAGRGLSFVKGGGIKGKQLLYTLAETTGTKFCMSDQARYAWKHGLFPVQHRRISVTVRILKSVYVSENRAQDPGSARDVPTTQPAAPDKGGEIVVSMCDNRRPSQEKPIKINALLDIKQLCSIAKNKFRISEKMSPTFYVDGGNGSPLEQGQPCEARAKIYVVVHGQPFQGRVTLSEDIVTQEDPESDPFLRFTDIKQQYQIWNEWRYPRLEFVTRRYRGENNAIQPVSTMEELDRLVQNSRLSVPELRELSFGLQESVFDRHDETGLSLGFSTDEDEQQRHTSIYVLGPAQEVLEFRVTGKPAVKGRKKRDGPLWSFEGGLNNPREHHLQHVNKRANAYQQKRGVIVSDRYVLFAGSPWLSSYFSCEMEVDGLAYTSVAQYVLHQQAKIFGDKEREAEILETANPAAPHKLYDHKAPKTGERKVKGFDAEIWKDHGDRLMWKGTWSKFTQNQVLKARLLETGNRKIVESTDDPLWGSGIAINHEHATNEKKWRGQNKMGALLMAVRDELRKMDN